MNKRAFAAIFGSGLIVGALISPISMYAGISVFAAGAIVALIVYFLL